MENLAIVTVTYNSSAVIGRLLAALQTPEAEVILVDNGSTDNTREIAAGFANMRVIACDNIGYGRAANVGFAQVKTPYVLLLNPDVEISAATIGQMLACMEQNPAIGILGANMTGNPAAGLVDVEWIVGALMLIRREALAKVGMFDENIFLFYEETDLCRRFVQAGWRLAILQSAMAGHEAGTSTPASLKVIKIKAWHSAWSKCYYYRKHFSYLTYCRKTAIKAIHAIRRLIRGAYRRRPDQVVKNFYEILGVLAYISGMGAFRKNVGRLT
ncbi:MAG: glycosyltransferase family 2 protein [Alphaproteobacteria bacterium]|nr:glycosyltransferase family 2 protein [Alphaproteobacteria bacterium]